MRCSCGKSRCCRQSHPRPGGGERGCQNELVALHHKCSYLLGADGDRSTRGGNQVRDAVIEIRWHCGAPDYKGCKPSAPESGRKGNGATFEDEMVA